MIKAIIFDLGEVIFLSDGGGFESREKLAKIFNIDVKKLHEFWFEHKEDLLCNREGEDVFIEQIKQLANNTYAKEDIQKSIKELNIIDPEMVKVLEHLKQKYVVAALTNEVKEWNEYRIKKFRLNHYFSFILASCDLGITKPTSKIYTMLLEKLNMNPEEVIFIDNREENLKPAEVLGIKTIHFKNKEELIKQLSKYKIY